MIKRALVPVHFNENRNRFDSIPLVLCSFGVTTAVLVHIADAPDKGNSAARSERIKSLGSSFTDVGLRVEYQLTHGSAALTISRLARQKECELIAFSWKRKSWIQRALTGSTTLDAIRLSDSAVFVNKEPQRTVADTMAESPILYATGFHAADAAVLRLLNDPPLTKHRLDLLHVAERAPDPVAEAERRRRAERGLKRLAREYKGPSQIHQVESASVPATIARTARRIGAHLIVIGKSSQHDVSTILGSTAERVAYSASTSVLIVPAELAPPDTDD